jgi:transposase-like protein
MNLGDPVSYEAVKREHTRALLSKYSIEEAARILGKNPSTLYRYRRKAQIERVVPPPPHPLEKEPPTNPSPATNDGKIV